MQNDKAKFKKEFIHRLIKFSLKIIQFCEKLRKDPNLRPIADQLIRSGTSVGANVIEAKSLSSKKDYLNYFQIALKSANETKYWLLIIKEASSQFRKEAEELLSEAEEIANILASSILTLKGKK